MSKVEFIPRHHKTECYLCKGKGCSQCNNTGIYTTETWFLVYKDRVGQKQAFLVDGLK
jgi:hypothetical protein